MAGLAPAASKTFAMRSMDTKFVIHWIRGLWTASRCITCSTGSGLI